MHRLYLYYCYQLGILPKKQQPRINRPELERIWKDTEKILAEHAFVHDHKFPSVQAIVDYREGLSHQMEVLATQRTEIAKQKKTPPIRTHSRTGSQPNAAAWMAPVTGPAPAMEENWWANTVQPLVGT